MLTKKKIIEQQKALIADLREEIEHKEKMINAQTDRIFKLTEELAFYKVNNKASDIDFPNTSERSKTTSGNIDINDILFH